MTSMLSVCVEVKLVLYARQGLNLSNLRWEGREGSLTGEDRLRRENAAGKSNRLSVTAAEVSLSVKDQRVALVIFMEINCPLILVVCAIKLRIRTAFVTASLPKRMR